MELRILFPHGDGSPLLDDHTPNEWLSHPWERHSWVVGGTHTSQRDRGSIHNCKPFLLSTLKEVGVLARTNNKCLLTAELFQVWAQNGVGSSRGCSHRQLKAMLKFGQVSLCRSLERMYLSIEFTVFTNTFSLTLRAISWLSQYEIFEFSQVLYTCRQTACSKLWVYASTVLEMVLDSEAWSHCRISSKLLSHLQFHNF